MLTISPQNDTALLRKRQKTTNK